MAHKQIAASVATIGLLAGPALSQETQLTVDDAVAIALEAQPGTIAEAEEGQFDGRIVAEIEVLNEAGEEIEFMIDLASGDILSIVADDDPTDDPLANVLEDVTFLIPGHPGGGWDTQSRAIGQAFTATGIIDDLSFDNRDGNNGGIGLTYMIENAGSLPKTIMLNTTQIVARSLNGTYSDSYAELVPVAAPLGDYAAFIAHPESEIQSMTDLVTAYQGDPGAFAIGGGSAPNGMDHVISALVMKAAGADPAINYVQFEAPEPAFAALMSGDVMSLTTEYIQALALAEQGIVRIIGVSAPDDFALPSDIANMNEQGVEMEFVTWSGFFAPPGTEPEMIEAYQDAFSTLYETDAWAGIMEESGGTALKLDAVAFAALLEAQHKDIEDVLQALGSR
ncbi:MAG: tripartite tricarboxylate transporter substrate-binding protein [Pseudomonadota bacterium]